MDKIVSGKIVSGKTQPGKTDWEVYATSPGIYVDVDTTAAGFSTIPVYITSIGGTDHHWTTTGGSSVYYATEKGFRVYLRWFDGRPVTPEEANQWKWHVNWIGVEA
jgi:hypothetical protein